MLSTKSTVADYSALARRSLASRELHNRKRSVHVTRAAFSVQRKVANQMRTITVQPVGFHPRANPPYYVFRVRRYTDNKFTNTGFHVAYAPTTLTALYNALRQRYEFDRFEYQHDLFYNIPVE